MAISDISIEIRSERVAGMVVLSGIRILNIGYSSRVSLCRNQSIKSLVGIVKGQSGKRNPNRKEDSPNIYFLVSNRKLFNSVDRATNKPLNG